MKNKPLLVAVDFSDLSERALHYAVELAEGRERRIDLLHVAQNALPAHAAAHAPPEVLERIRKGEESIADEQLHALFERVVPQRLRGEVRLERGNAAEKICAAAGEGYELVVVSTHGRTGLSQLLLGSVAERVVRLAPIPVLVVR